MLFSEITGHEDVKAMLRNYVDSGRIPHALMLSGVAGLGKLRLAMAFSQYLHCADRRNGDACGVCPSCLQHQAFNFPDMIYVYPVVKKMLSRDYADEWKEYLSDNPFNPFREWGPAIEAGNTSPVIYVTEADEIVRLTSLSTYSADKRVILMWLPEKLQPAAANKLLKVLEEPFENTVFLLVSNDPQQILPTILSRTQRIDVNRVDEETITAWLEKSYGADPFQACEAARLSEGIPGKAFEIITHDAETSEFMSLFQRMMRTAYSRAGADLKGVSEEIAAMGRQKTARYFDYCQGQLRENLVYNLHKPELNLMSADEEAFSSRFAPFIHLDNVRQMSDEMSRASSDIMRNANAKVVCFDMMLKLCGLIRIPRAK